MNDLEGQIQTKVIVLCKYLNEHVEKWRLCLQESAIINKAISNQSEQLRHVEKFQNLDRKIDDFEEKQNFYKFSILNGIEVDIQAIKQIIEKLNKANQELNNKLSTLEKLTLQLDWDLRCDLTDGTPIQPPLSRILDEGLQFWLFFRQSLQNINDKFKLIDVRNERSIDNFKRAFKVDLDNKVVLDFIVITQYVDNAKAVL